MRTDESPPGMTENSVIESPTNTAVLCLERERDMSFWVWVARECEEGDGCRSRAQVEVQASRAGGAPPFLPASPLQIPPLCVAHLPTPLTLSQTIPTRVISREWTSYSVRRRI